MLEQCCIQCCSSVLYNVGAVFEQRFIQSWNSFVYNVRTVQYTILEECCIQIWNSLFYLMLLIQCWNGARGCLRLHLVVIKGGGGAVGD